MAIAELQTRYLILSQFVDEKGIDKSAEDAMRNSPQYQRFGSLFLGEVSDKFGDTDLKELQDFAQQFALVQLIKFFTAVRSISEIVCIPANVILIMLGEKPSTIQRYDAGSFVEKERIMSRAGRNFLPPKTPPAPFPATTFKPQVQPE